MKLNEVKILPSCSFVVEIIEDASRSYVVRTPQGAPVVISDYINDVAQFLHNLDLSLDK